MDPFDPSHAPELLFAEVSDGRLVGQVIPNQLDGGVRGQDFTAAGGVAKAGAAVKGPTPPLFHRLGEPRRYRCRSAPSYNRFLPSPFRPLWLAWPKRPEWRRPGW